MDSTSLIIVFLMFAVIIAHKYFSDRRIFKALDRLEAHFIPGVLEATDGDLDLWAEVDLPPVDERQFG